MKRFAMLVVLLLMGFFFSVPAMASETAPDCVKANVQVDRNGLSEYTVSTTGDDCTVYLATYLLPDTWDGKGWNETASPQKLFGVVSQVVTEEPVLMHASLPGCGSVQTDLVLSSPPEEITYPGGLAEHGVVKVDSTTGTLENECNETVKTQVSVDFIEPTCDDHRGGVLSEYNRDLVNLETQGEVGPGQEISLIFTPVNDTVIITTETVFTHTFDMLPKDCNDKPDKPSPPDKPDNPSPPDVPDQPELPQTGGNLMAMLMVGFGLIGSGGVLVRKFG